MSPNGSASSFAVRASSNQKLCTSIVAKRISAAASDSATSARTGWSCLVETAVTLAATLSSGRVPPVLHHALLGVSVAALGAAGVRAASPLAAEGLARGLVAATFASAAVVAEALALALFALGGSTAALAIAAIATWVLARLLLPDARVRLGDELALWWGSRSAAERFA